MNKLSTGVQPVYLLQTTLQCLAELKKLKVYSYDFMQF